MINVKQYRSILCLDGELPSADFFNLDLPIIAADGAANTLMDMGVTPQIVIGDLDSLLPKNAEKLQTLLHDDQNYCDFEKCLQYLEKNKLLPTIIVGINGGCLDHTLNNINHFMRSNCLLYAPPMYGFVMHDNEEKTLPTLKNTKISFIGIPSATVSTQGLKWNLSETKLSFPGSNSCFNRSEEEMVNIKIHTGNVLVLIYETTR